MPAPVNATSLSRSAVRRVLGYAAMALVAMAAAHLLVELVQRVGAERVSPQKLGSVATWLDRLLILGVFGWLGTRVVRARWWEGAAAGAFALLAARLGWPVGRFIVAALQSDERLEMARLIGMMFVARLFPLIAPGLLLLTAAGAATTFAVSRIRSQRTAPDAPGPLWEIAGVAAAGLTAVVFIASALLILLGLSGPPVPGMATPDQQTTEERSAAPANPPTIRLRGAMSGLQAHQELYFASESRYAYADDPALLDFEYPNAIVRIVFADGNGWAGTVTDAGNGDRCAIAVGTVPEDVRIAVVGRDGPRDVPVCSLRTGDPMPADRP